MKTMSCRQLGGACDLEFHGDTFEEIMTQSKNHGKDMFQQKDMPHLKAMQEMQALMQNPEAMQRWMNEKRSQFDRLSG